MKENREVTLDFILQWEGNDLNTSPTEPGGASKYGVSVDLLTDYFKTLGKPKAAIADVAALTDTDARQIYSVMLLDVINFDALPSGVDYRLADIATNLGRTGGIQLLQLCLAMFPLTGKIDDDTLTLVNSEDPKALVKSLGAAWIAVKHTSPNWGPSPVTKSGFGHGWSNRNKAQTPAALALIK